MTRHPCDPPRIRSSINIAPIWSTVNKCRYFAMSGSIRSCDVINDVTIYVTEGDDVWPLPCVSRTMCPQQILPHYNTSSHQRKKENLLIVQRNMDNKNKHHGFFAVFKACYSGKYSHIFWPCWFASRRLLLGKYSPNKIWIMTLLSSIRQY